MIDGVGAIMYYARRPHIDTFPILLDIRDWGTRGVIHYGPYKAISLTSHAILG